MDLRRHLAVLARWRAIVIAAAVLGFLLALLATFNIGSHGLSWRKPEVFQSDSVLLVTQNGFPWGRANLSIPGETTQATPRSGGSSGAQFADPSRYTSLATIYSFLVRSQAVLNMIPGHPDATQIAAQPFKDTSNSAGNLPVIGLSTTAPSAAAATKLNHDTITALGVYLRRQQNATQVPDQQRAVVTVLNPPGAAVVSQGHKLTKTIAIFLLVALGGAALAYVLENLRMGRERQLLADSLAVPSDDLDAMEERDGHRDGHLTASRGRGHVRP